MVFRVLWDARLAKAQALSAQLCSWDGRGDRHCMAWVIGGTVSLSASTNIILTHFHPRRVDSHMTPCVTPPYIVVE